MGSYSSRNRSEDSRLSGSRSLGSDQIISSACLFEPSGSLKLRDNKNDGGDSESMSLEPERLGYFLTVV